MTDFLRFRDDPDQHRLLVDGANGMPVGVIEMAVDGFWVFYPLEHRHGYWTEELLTELSVKLKTMNARWRKQIANDMKGIR